MASPADPYSLADLARVGGVTPRTIRYYIAQGLLPAPSQMGTNARYSERHLERIRAVKRLQREHLPLAEIRNRLAALDDRQVAEIARSPSGPPESSAADYIRSIMPAAPIAAPAFRVLHEDGLDEPAQRAWARAVQSQPAAQPDRSQWDRITLSADVELHVRRPLTRHHNRLVDRLIATARQLFEEERP